MAELETMAVAAGPVVEVVARVVVGDGAKWADS